MLGSCASHVRETKSYSMRCETRMTAEASSRCRCISSNIACPPDSSGISRLAELALGRFAKMALSAAFRSASFSIVRGSGLAGFPQYCGILSPTAKELPGAQSTGRARLLSAGLVVSHVVLKVPPRSRTDAASSRRGYPHKSSPRGVRQEICTVFRGRFLWTGFRRRGVVRVW